MKAKEIMGFLLSTADNVELPTVDTLKAGDENKEVRKVAVTCFPSVSVIRQAEGWGADMFVAHEPLYYNHWDNHTDDPVEMKKRELIEKTGMTFYRFHDTPHSAFPDMITEGELKVMALDGKYEKGWFLGINRFTLAKPMTARALAASLESTLKLKHVRICGNADFEATKLITAFGYPGHTKDMMKLDECEIVLLGEIVEWSDCEYVRDAAALGAKKAVLILGHSGSERNGMDLVAQILADQFPELEVKYFDSGEVYTYPEF